ncbi:MAG: FecR domain-containing protein [Bryobacteraceae bacterium]
MPEDRFDELLQEMREETATAEQVVEAKDRVWRKLAGRAAPVCPEFRPQLDDYLAGRLSEPRRLLLEDHLSRCAECRRVFAEVKGERKVVAMPGSRRRPLPVWAKWAVAAGVAALAIYSGRDRIDSALAPGEPRATVVSVQGNLYRVPQGVLHQGAALSEGETVRTGPGARAVLKLMDGSLMEMNERTELAVHAAWSGQRVRLERGDVIVQAARQRRGHLRVATREAVVAVKGTIFAVSSGSAGSLVSVVEGRVAVSQLGAERVLQAGGQAATTQALASVPVREAVSWSENADKYYALLAELINIEKQVAEMPGPAPRTQARLLRYLPAGSFIYGAIPNLSGTIRHAVWLVEQRARENAALNEWWTSPDGQKMKKLLDSAQVVTPLLGEEVVFVLAKHPTQLGDEVPMMLAEVQPGRRAALQQGLDKIAQEDGHPIHYRLTDELLLISDSAAKLGIAQGLLGSGANSSFAAEIQRRYERGAGWILGLDVPALAGKMEAIGQTDTNEAARLLGVSRMRHLFFEQQSAHGTRDNEATLTFQGARTGIASWLATPGSAGSAEYVPSESVFALSASTRNPRQAFDELLGMLGQGAGDLAADLRQFEAETGINVGNDIAVALGADFTLAVERPSIPIPAWFGAIEVLHPALLDSTIRRLVDAVNRKAGERLILSEETVNGRMWTALREADNPTTLYWTYDRGYVVASTDRAAAARAIATRANGTPMIHSARFRAQLPGSGSAHNSGFIWINVQGALRDLAGLIQHPSLKLLLETRDPALIVLNGETERIHVASRTRLTSLILDLMVVSGPKPGADGKRM